MNSIISKQDGAQCDSAVRSMKCSADGCDHCDTFGGVKTYANQACLPLNGRVVCVDWCIHQIVAALNAGGVKTRACCCGHGRQPGRIDLEDGRVIRIEKPSMLTCTKCQRAINADEDAYQEYENNGRVWAHHLVCPPNAQAQAQPPGRNDGKENQ